MSLILIMTYFCLPNTTYFYLDPTDDTMLSNSITLEIDFPFDDTTDSSMFMCSAVLLDDDCPAAYTCITANTTTPPPDMRCDACTPGKYAPAPDVCLTCQPGTYSPAERSTACSECEPGYYTAGGGCEPCLAGTYASGQGMTVCLNCTPEMFDYCGSCTLIANCLYSRGSACISDNSTACECFPGFEMVNQTCVECGPGFFRSHANQPSCIPWEDRFDACPEGHYEVNGTRFHDSACVPFPEAPENATIIGNEWICDPGLGETLYSTWDDNSTIDIIVDYLPTE